jgi:Glycosyl hydrolase family 20, catalytic domain.
LGRVDKQFFLPEESIILGWQGMGTAALKAAEKGHRFIMTPARIMYLIRYQGPQWFEPVTYFGNNTLKDVLTTNLYRRIGNRNMSLC